MSSISMTRLIKPDKAKINWISSALSETEKLMIVFRLIFSGYLMARKMGNETNKNKLPIIGKADSAKIPSCRESESNLKCAGEWYKAEMK